MSATIAYYGGIVTDGLVLYMDAAKRDSYPGFGTNWNSVARGGLITGDLVNGPRFDSGNGGSIVFDGVDDYGQTQIINIASNGTINLWINKIGTGNPDANGDIDLFANVSNTGRYGWSAGIDTGVNKFNFYVANNGSTGVRDLSTTVILSNTWYNVALTYNGSKKIIYVNGNLDSEFNSTVNGINTSDFWGIATRITANKRYFQGKISSIILYNRALSASEVLQNYNATKGRFGL